MVIKITDKIPKVLEEWDSVKDKLFIDKCPKDFNNSVRSGILDSETNSEAYKKLFLTLSLFKLNSEQRKDLIKTLEVRLK